MNHAAIIIPFPIIVIAINVTAKIKKKIFPAVHISFCTGKNVSLPLEMLNFRVFAIVTNDYKE